MNKNLGTQIKALRLIKNYAQRYVAEALCISQPYLSRIERNEVAISEKQLEQLAIIFKLSVSSIKNCKVEKIENNLNEQNTKKLIEQYEKVLDVQNTIMLQQQKDNDELRNIIAKLQQELDNLNNIIKELRTLNVEKTYKHFFLKNTIKAHKSTL